MMRACFIFLLFTVTLAIPGVNSWIPFGSLVADDSEFQYLPAGLKVNKSIPTPEQHLGFRVGERHLQHHQLVSYVRRLANKSARIKLQVYGYSHGGRPCILLTITSPENHRRLKSIRNAHQQLAQPTRSGKVEITDLPAVINMGYSVHGDESSASNAAAVVAYYLAAGQGKQIDSILKNCVILLDPCLNPDGFDRFASWANGHVGRVQNADPNHVEHNQPFPGGRVNYYWFDLNRDWLPAQHPESQGRLEQYHAWKPNVVLDFHEMGTNSTYFFQPGIPTRNNPLTPKRNYDLTRKMSLYHAKALDKLGSLYMTEERFDDFYMGKGSTYPDLHGSVGILFEQASSRGHRQESINGELTFPFTIRNQVTTSLTSLQGTVDLRQQLLKFKREFYLQSLNEARATGLDHFEFRCDHDRSRLMSFAQVLLRHDLRVYVKPTETGSALVVPVRQPEFRFLLSLTEKRTQFQENIFYDVSTWHLPSAFGVNVQQIREPIDLTQLAPAKLKDLEQTNASGTYLQSQPQKTQLALAYVIDWRSSDAPQLVTDLLRQGIKVRVAQKKFSIDQGKEQLEFPHGTIMVPVGIQKTQTALIQECLSQSGVPYYPVFSGLTPKGIDLGSGRFAPVRAPKAAMLIGRGVSRYEAGEVWHLFDTRLQQPLSMIDTSRLAQTDLARYNSLILVSGTYSSLSDRNVDQIGDWIAKGGNLVLCGTACSWASSKGLADIKLVSDKDSPEPLNPQNQNPEFQPSGAETRANNGSSTKVKSGLQKPFDAARSDAALKLISGAIFETSVDPTHPVGYGYSNRKLAVFRNNRVIIKPSANPYTNAVVYTDSPQIAGYCSAENVDKLRNTAGVISLTRGDGTVIVIPQNPNFRAFWYGTNRLFYNAVIFGNLARN